MKKFIIMLCVFICSCTVYAEQPRFYKGVIPITNTVVTNLVEKSEYTLGFNNVIDEPVYTSEFITKKEMVEADALKRSFSRFTCDAQLPQSDCIPHDAYTGTHYDRGHCANAGDMPSLLAQKETFVTSNIVPQPHWHNNGVWKEIEIKSREIGDMYDDTYVITGNIFTKNDVIINSKGKTLRSPAYMYKAIFIVKENSYCIYRSSTTDKNFITELYSGTEFYNKFGISPIPAAQKTFTCNPALFKINKLNFIN